MKTLLLVTVAFAATVSAFAQYSATTLTRKVVPPQPTAPAQNAPQYAAPQAAAPQRELTPADAAKARVKKDKNEIKQFEFYQRRAEEGSDDAQYQLAMRYLAGKGTTKDEKLGREWLAKAAKQGHALASKQLADLGGNTPKALSSPAPPAPAANPQKK